MFHKGLMVLCAVNETPLAGKGMNEIIPAKNERNYQTIALGNVSLNLKSLNPRDILFQKSNKLLLDRVQTNITPLFQMEIQNVVMN